MNSNTFFAQAVAQQAVAQCVECDRVFDLWDEDEAGEWFYGHDCEVA